MPRKKPLRRAPAVRYCGMRGSATEVRIRAGAVELEGELVVPSSAQGIVLFAHGSGSSRHSRRNQFVAGVIQRAGLATLLFDLLTREEEEEDSFTGHLRFNIPFLAARLVEAARFLRDEEETAKLRQGFFGSSTGGGAAIVAAAELGRRAGAVVSRGGRPDFAGPALREISCPTLLIVGGRDDVVLPLNEEAFAKLRCPKSFQIIPGATHLFEEPGALEQVADRAAEWFRKHLEEETA